MTENRGAPPGSRGAPSVGELGDHFGAPRSFIGLAVENRQRRTPVPLRTLTRTAERALRGLGREGGGVEITLVDDVEIRRLNRAFRGVARRTDVLAFPLEVAEAPGGLVGQIVISVDTAERQSRRLGVPLALELQLLVTHGILHLIGYDDRDPVEAHLMHRREHDVLTAAHGKLPPRLWKGLLHA